MRLQELIFWMASVNLCRANTEIEIVNMSICGVDNGGCDHICESDGSGAPRCYCYNGYSITEDRTCIDIDECQLHNGNCMQKCVNIEGTWRCDCYSGYRHVGQTVGKECIDINECQKANGGCQEICINMPGTFFCRCKWGNVNKTHCKKPSKRLEFVSGRNIARTEANKDKIGNHPALHVVVPLGAVMIVVVVVGLVVNAAYRPSSPPPSFNQDDQTKGCEENGTSQLQNERKALSSVRIESAGTLV